MPHPGEVDLVADLESRGRTMHALADLEAATPVTRVTGDLPHPRPLKSILAGEALVHLARYAPLVAQQNQFFRRLIVQHATESALAEHEALTDESRVSYAPVWARIFADVIAALARTPLCSPLREWVQLCTPDSAVRWGTVGAGGYEIERPVHAGGTVRLSTAVLHISESQDRSESSDSFRSRG